jgi:hypothetical protein
MHFRIIFVGCGPVSFILSKLNKNLKISPIFVNNRASTVHWIISKTAQNFAGPDYAFANKFCRSWIRLFHENFKILLKFVNNRARPVLQEKTLVLSEIKLFLIISSP